MGELSLQAEATLVLSHPQTSMQSGAVSLQGEFAGAGIGARYSAEVDGCALADVAAASTSTHDSRLRKRELLAILSEQGSQFKCIQRRARCRLLFHMQGQTCNQEQTHRVVEVPGARLRSSQALGSTTYLKQRALSQAVPLTAHLTERAIPAAEGQQRQKR